MKKLSWGTKLGMFASIYVIGVLAFVVFSTTQDINLISKDYYPQGIEYQDKIDKIKNAQSLIEKLIVSQNAGTIQIQFPEGMRNNLSGTVTFYRPSGAENDLYFDLKLDESGIQTFNSDRLIKGRYTIQVDWKQQTREYYYEEAIYFSR